MSPQEKTLRDAECLRGLWRGKKMQKIELSIVKEEANRVLIFLQEQFKEGGFSSEVYSEMVCIIGLLLAFLPDNPSNNEDQTRVREQSTDETPREDSKSE